MTRNMRFTGVLIVLGLAVGCSKNETPNPISANVNLHFAHLVDGNDVVLDRVLYSNAVGQDYSVKTIKYFISRVQLHTAENKTVDMEDILYVDVRTEESLSQTLEAKIPEGNYTGISFVYGLVPDDNITGRFTAPPESLMEWPVPMGGGYHYMKLEGEYVINDESNFYNFHAGMLNGQPYEVHVDLTSTAFTVKGQQVDLEIAMEIQNWFKNPNNWDFAYFGGGIMGNAEAQQTVHDNGQDVFNVNVIDPTE